VEERTVATAVQTLVDRGDPISVRRILAMTGGSSRDVQRHLRALKARMASVAIDAEDVDEGADGSVVTAPERDRTGREDTYGDAAVEALETPPDDLPPAAAEPAVCPTCHGGEESYWAEVAERGARQAIAEAYLPILRRQLAATRARIDALQGQLDGERAHRAALEAEIAALQADEAGSERRP